MRRLCFVVSLGLCLGFANMVKAQQSYQNPVIDISVPDPSIIKAHDGYYYLFATEDIPNVPIFRSHNLVNWKQVGTAFTKSTRPTFLKNGSVWAPDVNYINGRYVMYYSLSKWGEGWANGIGVAVADSPDGPYTDLGKLFTSSEIGVKNSIDPFFFTDNDKNYLFWGSFTGIYCIELSEDGLSVKTGVSKTKVINKTVEASSVIKHNGYYYYIGSSGTCCAGIKSTYKLVMARSTSLASGYKNKNGQDVLSDGESGPGPYVLTDLLTSDGIHSFGPGHCSEIVQDNEGNCWMLYHGYTADDVNGGRKVFLSQVKWDSDGWPYIDGGHPATTAQAPVLSSVQEISSESED